MDVSIFDPPAEDRRSQVTKGIFLTSAAQGLKFVLQILSIVVMSRLLSPTDFGVIAMTGPIVNFMGTLQELGLSQAAMQRAILGQRQASTLFWLNVVVATIVAIFIIILGHIGGQFYRDNRVTYLLWASAPLCWFGSIYTIHAALLARKMRFDILAIVESSAAIVGLIVAIAFGFLLHNYWAIFAFSVASSVTSCIGFLIATRWMPSRPARDKEFRSLLNFGAGVTGFNTANFFARNLDNVLIGRTWGSVPLGFYDRAYKLLLFPLQQVNNPVQRVVTPALARLLEEPDRYCNAWSRTVRFMAMVTVPGICGVAICADWFVALALGAKWAGVVPIFRVLAVAGLLQIFGNPIGWLFLTQGRSGEFARWGLFSATTCILSFVIGLPKGPLGVAFAYAASEILIRTPALWWYVGRKGPVRTKDIVKLVAPFAAAVMPTVIILMLFRAVWTGGPIVGMIGSMTLCFGTFWSGLICFATERQALREAIVMVAGLQPRRRGPP